MHTVCARTARGMWHSHQAVSSIFGPPWGWSSAQRPHKLQKTLVLFPKPMSGFGRVYESDAVKDAKTAQDFYVGRELTERKIPFNAGSTYKETFTRHNQKPRESMKAKLAGHTLFNAPGKTATSLYSEDFRKFASGTVGKAKPPSYLSTELPPDIPLLTATNYQNDFTVPGPGPHRAAIHEELDSVIPARPFDGRTNYNIEYTDKKGKPAKLSELSNMAGKGNAFNQIPDVPFTGTSDYKKNFVQFRPNPHTKGPLHHKPIPVRKLDAVTTMSTIGNFKGLQLPTHRANLGLQAINDRFHVLIPREKTWPAQDSYVFSTHNDNQKELCILILLGTSHTASDNKLIGQFTVTNIPDAPRQTPAIEVTFKVDYSGKLTAEAKDLDTKRHKAWTQAGGTIELKAAK